MIDQHLNDRRPSLVPGPMQRRAPGFGLDIRVDAEIQEQPHRFHIGLRRPFVGVALDPADPRGDL